MILRNTFINTLKRFWPIIDQRKTRLVIFYEKGERVHLAFWPQYYFLWPEVE